MGIHPTHRPLPPSLIFSTKPDISLQNELCESYLYPPKHQPVGNQVSFLTFPPKNNLEERYRQLLI